MKQKTVMKPEEKKKVCDDLIKILEDYREALYNDPKTSSTKFSHKQTALHWAKQLIRKYFDQPTEKRASAWVK